MPRAGEKPSIGTYRCMKCGIRIKFMVEEEILEDTVLPRCSKCGYADWAHIGKQRLETVDEIS